MFKIKETDINIIIHDILKIVGKMKTMEDSLSSSDTEKLQKLENALLHIRQEILESVENNGKEELKILDELLLKAKKINKSTAVTLLLERIGNLFKTLKWRIDNGDNDK